MLKALPFDPFGSPRNSPRFAKKGPAKSPSYPNEISAAMLRQQKLQPGSQAFFVFLGGKVFHTVKVFEKKEIHQGLRNFQFSVQGLVCNFFSIRVSKP